MAAFFGLPQNNISIALTYVNNRFRGDSNLAVNTLLGGHHLLKIRCSDGLNSQWAFRVINGSQAINVPVRANLNALPTEGSPPKKFEVSALMITGNQAASLINATREQFGLFWDTNANPVDAQSDEIEVVLIPPP